MADTSTRRPAMRRGRGPTFEKPKDFKGTFKKLLKYLMQFKAACVVVVIAALCSTLFNVVGPKILGMATTELFAGVQHKFQGTGGIEFGIIGKILAFTLAIYLASSAFSFIQGWLMTGVSQKICFRLRADISEKIDRMPMKYFESHTVGEVLSRITNDIDTLGQGLNQSLTQLITSVVTVAGIIIVMLTINPLLTVIAVLVVPLSAALMLVVMKKSQPYFKRQQSSLGEINGQIEETFSGQNVVKAFNREDAVIAEFEKTNGELYESAWKHSSLQDLCSLS